MFIILFCCCFWNNSRLPCTRIPNQFMRPISTPSLSRYIFYVPYFTHYHTSLSWQNPIFRLESCSLLLSTTKSVTQALIPSCPGLPPIKSFPFVVRSVVSVETLTGGNSSICIIVVLRRRDAFTWWNTPSSTLTFTKFNNQ